MKTIGNMKVPVNSLEALLDATKKIYKDSEGKEITRARIAELLDHAPTGGAFNDKIKDLKEYGLVEGRANKYLVTELGKKVAVPRDDSEENAALLEAVKNIELWKELLEDVGTSIKPENFWHYLENITGADRSVAKTNADTVMKAYLKDVGLIESVGEPKKAPLVGDEEDLQTAGGASKMDTCTVSKEATMYVGFPEYSRAPIEIKDKDSYSFAKQLLIAIGSRKGWEVSQPQQRTQPKKEQEESADENEADTVDSKEDGMPG